jgi:hypothetical protein
MNKPPLSPITPEREALLRDYAAGTVTWHSLRERGFDNYLEVLGGLGELGLRPPVAPMDGPNIAARQRGRALLRRLLQQQPRP